MVRDVCGTWREIYLADVQLPGPLVCLGSIQRRSLVWWLFLFLFSTYLFSLDSSLSSRPAPVACAGNTVATVKTWLLARESKRSVDRLQQLRRPEKAQRVCERCEKEMAGADC